MKSNIIVRWFSLVGLLMLMLSCTDGITQERLINEEPVSSLTYNSTDDFVFGSRYEIPYSIENLRKAYDTLDPHTKAEINLDELSPTHYYVRFAPLNGEDLDILLNDENLILYEFPMDVEIIKFGSSFHDPSLPEDRPTYQYTVVDVNYWETLIKSIDFEYQKLMEVYMPENQEYYVETKSIFKSNSSYQSLLKAAFELTGHEFIPETKSSWTPSGYIKSFDNIAMQCIPIKKVRVRGKHLLKTVEALTDTNGYYCFPNSFNNTPTMMVVWESDMWDIRDGTTGQAYTSKSCVFGQPWNVNIYLSDAEGVRFAAIHRAAYRTFYGFHYNIAPPFYTRKLKLGLVDEINNGNAKGCFNRTNLLGAGLDIEIAKQSASASSFSVSEIFSTTCHELGHALHYTSPLGNYSGSEERMVESWGIYIQYLYTRREYNELGIEAALVLTSSIHSGILFEDADFAYNFQERVFTIDQDLNEFYQEYTPIFVDLYDDYNQLVYYDYQFYTIHPNDNIHGLTPDQIMYYAFFSTSFEELKNALIQIANNYPSNPYGITEENVEDLFSVYDGF